MKARVQLVYEDANRNHDITVEVAVKKVTTLSFLDKADRAVEKAVADDKDWMLWNLIEIIDDLADISDVTA